MTDITKCTNDSCPLAESCYRVTAPSSDWQSVCKFKYTETTDGVKCDHYWKERRKK